MATTMDEVQHYDAAPDEVFAMLSDAAFIERKCLASGCIEAGAEVTAEDDGSVTLVSRRVLPAKLPSFAKRFVGETVTLIETQRWSAPDETSRSAADFVVDFGNNPITFHGAIELVPDGSGTHVEYTGRIRCTVPLIGGKIEGVALEWITRYVNKEQRLGTAWLQGDR